MSKYTTFIDNTGRNVIATVESETPDTLTVNNPVVVLVQPQQNGQLSVQLIPLFLNEFVKTDANGKRSFAFTFAKASIAVGVGFEIDERILTQYDRILSATSTPPAPTKGPEVIKLFED